MSYDISFKAKIEGIDKYVIVGDCDVNITWNLREMIEQSTGLPWINEANNGLCSEVMPKILHGYHELCHWPNKYVKYEAPNGWGTVEGCRNFFERLLCAWRQLKEDDPILAKVATFWIE